MNTIQYNKNKIQRFGGLGVIKYDYDKIRSKGVFNFIWGALLTITSRPLDPDPHAASPPAPLATQRRLGSGCCFLPPHALATAQTLSPLQSYMTPSSTFNAYLDIEHPDSVYLFILN